jgi:hypothetical protein
MSRNVNDQLITIDFFVLILNILSVPAILPGRMPEKQLFRS